MAIFTAEAPAVGSHANAVSQGWMNEHAEIRNKGQLFIYSLLYMLTQKSDALALVFHFQPQYLYKITRMYKYGKELRGWIEDEDELMEL